MITVPTLTPVTTPLVPTVAIPPTVLLQTPPDVASDNVTVLPTHTVTGVDGLIGNGVVFTVTVVVAVHDPIE